MNVDFDISYGEVEYNGETAVNLFVDILQDQSGKKYTSQSVSIALRAMPSIAKALYTYPH